MWTRAVRRSCITEHCVTLFFFISMNRIFSNLVKYATFAGAGAGFLGISMVVMRIQAGESRQIAPPPRRPAAEALCQHGGCDRHSGGPQRKRRHWRTGGGAGHGGAREGESVGESRCLAFQNRRP